MLYFTPFYGHFFKNFNSDIDSEPVSYRLEQIRKETNKNTMRVMQRPLWYGIAFLDHSWHHVGGREDGIEVRNAPPAPRR